MPTKSKYKYWPFLGAHVSVCDNGTAGRAMLGFITAVGEPLENGAPAYIRVLFEPYGWFMSAEAGQRSIVRTFYATHDYDDLDAPLNEHRRLCYQTHYLFQHHQDSKDSFTLINEYATVIIDGGYQAYTHVSGVEVIRNESMVVDYTDFKIEVGTGVEMVVNDEGLPADILEQVQCHFSHFVSKHPDASGYHLRRYHPGKTTAITHPYHEFSVESGSGGALKEYVFIIELKKD